MKTSFRFSIYLCFLVFGALSAQDKPNIVYMHIDNLGFGEISAYDGGLTRGAMTPNIDKLAKDGLKLLNYAPESQCTPSRSALMTGRYAIRSGNHTVAMAGTDGGLVDWEKTIAEVLKDEGYNTACLGKWHVGASDGFWPTDQGFDQWYGPPHSYDECLWTEDPWYNPERDGIAYMYEGTSNTGAKATSTQLTVDVKRNLDVEYLKRSKAFMEQSIDDDKPFYLYFNHTLMHLPLVPRDEFKGKSGRGEIADCIMQLDADVATLLSYLDELGIAENTIVVFAGDNGPEGATPWKGDGGRFNGSYFSGSEANLRTPCIIRYPSKVPAGKESNEVVHITDMFTTLAKWAGGKVPSDRIIDGVDQTPFFEGKQENSAREGFVYFMGDVVYGVKWQNFKLKFVEQKDMYSPREVLPTPYLINLDKYPKENEPMNYPQMHTWAFKHLGNIYYQFLLSAEQEPFIKMGSAVDFVPKSKK